MIQQHQCGHGFDNWNRTGKNAGVVAATAHQFGFLAGGVHSLLYLQYSGGGLKANPEVEFLPIGDPSLYAAGYILT